MIKKIFFLGTLTLAVLVIYYFFPEKKLPGGEHIDRIEVYKEENLLIAYAGSEVLKEYSISLGRKPSDAAENYEDDRLPPGEYTVWEKNKRSRFHKTINLATQQEVDDMNKKNKKIAKARPLMIHGMRRGYGFIGKFHRWINWTKGGIAVTDEEMDELFNTVEMGTVVVINP